MAAEKDTKDDEIVAVGPGVEDDPENAGTRAEGTDGEYTYPEGDEEEGGESEERLGRSEEDPDGEDEPEGDGKPLTREQRRRRNRKRKKEEIAQDRDYWRDRALQAENTRDTRISAVEARQNQTDIVTIDGRIAQAEANVTEVGTLLAAAIKAGDEVAIAQALETRDKLRDGLVGYRAMKARAQAEAQRRPQSQQTQAPPYNAQAERWKQENPWFDGRNTDSQVALAIERRVAAERRLNPMTKQYWDEVDQRCARALPDLYEAEEDDDPPPLPRNGSRNGNGNTRNNGGEQRRESRPANGGPSFRVGGRERPLKKGEVYISEERKQAMIESGKWDDPKARERQMRYYQQHDREHGRRRQ